jgi:hypothetical protein
MPLAVAIIELRRFGVFVYLSRTLGSGAAVMGLDGGFTRRCLKYCRIELNQGCVWEIEVPVLKISCSLYSLGFMASVVYPGKIAI